LSELLPLVGVRLDYFSGAVYTVRPTTTVSSTFVFKSSFGVALVRQLGRMMMCKGLFTLKFYFLLLAEGVPTSNLASSARNFAAFSGCCNAAVLFHEVIACILEPTHGRAQTTAFGLFNLLREGI
jgi:hypothetical protein